MTAWYGWSQELLKTQSHRDTGSCKDFAKHHPPASQLFCMEVDDSDHHTQGEGKKRHHVLKKKLLPKDGRGKSEIHPWKAREANNSESEEF